MRASGAGALVAWLTLGAVTAVVATTTAAQAAAPVGTPIDPLPSSRAATPLARAATTAPLAQTTDPSALTESAATLSGTVAPVEPTALTFFEWGFTASYGRTTPEVHLTGSGSQPVSAALGDLIPSTTYHYRLVAANGTGTTRTADATFTTAPAPLLAGAPGAGGTTVGSPTATATTTAAATPTAPPTSTRAAVLTVGRGGATGTPKVSTKRVREPVIRLPVTCASGPTCSGSITVDVPRRATADDARTSAAVGSAGFTIPSGTRVTLAIAITPAARTLITRAKRAGQFATAGIALDGQALTRQRFALANQR